MAGDRYQASGAQAEWQPGSGDLYDWAGEERSVNIAKGNFHFAAAAQIPRLLTEFERDGLHRYTPCEGLGGDALAEAIAVCHVELILVHPFREGKGRLARLLADVMAVQAGRGPLDYSSWDADKSSYFAAIQRGMGRDGTAGFLLGLLALAARQPCRKSRVQHRQGGR